MRRTILAVGFLVLSLVPAQAQFNIWCTYPRTPSCVDDSSTYSSRRSIMDCKMSLDLWASNADRYFKCARQELKDNARHAEDVVRRFMSRAR